MYKMDSDSLYDIHKEWKAELTRKLEQFSQSLIVIDKRIIQLAERQASNSGEASKASKAQAILANDLNGVTRQVQMLLSHNEIFNTFEQTTNEHIKAIRRQLNRLNVIVTSLKSQSQTTNADLVSVGRKIKDLTGRVETTEGSIGDFQTALSTLRWVAGVIVAIVTAVGGLIAFVITYKQEISNFFK